MWTLMVKAAQWLWPLTHMLIVKVLEHPWSTACWLVQRLCVTGAFSRIDFWRMLLSVSSSEVEAGATFKLSDRIQTHRICKMFSCKIPLSETS